MRLPDDLISKMKAGLSQEDCDEMAIPSYLHRNPLMRWMAWKRVQIVESFVDHARQRIGRPLHVVDYGCGIGVLFRFLANAAEKVTAVDVITGPAELHLATIKHDNICVRTPDTWRPVSNSCDLIVAAEVLEHIDPVSEVLNRFKNALKEDGRLLVSLPTENRFYRLGRWLAGFSGHYHHQNAKSLHRAILEAGFVMENKKVIPLPGPLSIYLIATYRVDPSAGVGN